MTPSYTLSDKEKHIITVTESDARLSAKEIAEECGMSEASIRYHIRSLIERRIIRCTPLINIKNSGYSYFSVYFSLIKQGGTHEKKLLKALIDSPICVWLSEMGGEYQYGIELCVPNVYVVDKFLNDLCSILKIQFFHKLVASQVALHYWGRSYLDSDEQIERVSHRVAYDYNAEALVDLDDTDRLLLANMSQDHFYSRRNLAKNLNLPLSTVDLRVKKLEERGVICGYVYEVDPAAIGRQEYKLLLHTRGTDAKLEAALDAFGRSYPGMVRMYSCLGPWDYDIVVDVKEGREVGQITRDLYNQFKDHINTIKVLPKYNQMKAAQVPW